MILKKYKKSLNNFDFELINNLIEDIENELINQEFSILEKNSNRIDFTRNQIGRNDPSDKFGIYRRVQYKGSYNFIKNGNEIEVNTNLNFSMQLTAILLGLLPPLIIWNALSSNVSVFTVAITLIFYLLISAIWYQISLIIGENLSIKILSNSIKKTKRKNIQNIRELNKKTE